MPQGINMAVDKSTRKKVDPVRAMELRQKGLTLQEIAESTGVSRQAVHQQINRVTALLAAPQELEQYRERQAEIMDSIGIRYGARLLDEDAIKGASALQAASVLGIVTDKARLIRGQNTGTVLVVHANAVRESAKIWEAEVVDNSDDTTRCSD